MNRSVITFILIIGLLAENCLMADKGSIVIVVGAHTVKGTFTGIQTFELSGMVHTKVLPAGGKTMAMKLFKGQSKEFAVIKITQDKGPVLSFLEIPV